MDYNHYRICSSLVYMSPLVRVAECIGLTVLRFVSTRVEITNVIQSWAAEGEEKIMEEED